MALFGKKKPKKKNVRGGTAGRKATPSRQNKNQEPQKGFGTILEPAEIDSGTGKKTLDQIAKNMKYSGNRKIFPILSAVLISALVLSVIALSTALSRPKTAQVQDLAEKKVEQILDTTFPTGDASVWLNQFIRVWGTWDNDTAQGRASDLSPYLSPALDSQAGWSGSGKQSVIYAAVSPDAKIVDGSRAIFSAAYQIQDGTWRCVKVPVFAYRPESSDKGPKEQWGFAVTANPAPYPCPLKITVPSYKAQDFPNLDAESADFLSKQFFPGFFSAWATSDENTLRQYMGPDIKTFGLGGAYTSKVRIGEVKLPIGNEDKGVAQPNKIYNAYVSVMFTDRNGGNVKATYKVPVTVKGASQWLVMGEPESVVEDLGRSGNNINAEQGRDTTKKDNPKYDKGTPAQPTQPGKVEATVPAGGTVE